MPQIDLSHVILGPTLSDRFTVRRRGEVVNEFGESVVTAVDTPNVVGVVTMANPSDLQRLDDQDRMRNSIVVVTTFRLQGPSPGVKPDIIIHGGVLFLVKDVNAYTRYGAGFVEVIASSTQSIDPPNE